MFNVLPEIFRKEIKSEYYLRYSVVILIAIIFLQISFLVFIFPSWLNSFYRQKEILAEAKWQKSKIVSKNADSILQTINSTNQNLNVILNNFNYSAVLPIVKEIISNKTSAITLTEFTYNNFAATPIAPMTISGVSRTREDLISFVDKLENLGDFSGVVSPISNLTKDNNINFVISLNTKSQ